MKKLLLGILILGSFSVFSQATKQESIEYNCRYELNSGSLSTQNFSGTLDLKENELSTKPSTAFSGAINTYAGGFRLYLMRFPQNLNLLEVVLQKEEDYHNSVTITPGGQIIKKPVVYSASYSYIKEQGQVGAVVLVDKKVFRKRFNGKLYCTLK